MVAAVLENSVNEEAVTDPPVAPNVSGPSDESATDNGPADTASSDGEQPINPKPRQRHRRRNPRSEPGHGDGSNDKKPAVVRKPPRAKSQPPSSTKEKENHRPSSRLDLNEIRRTVKDVSLSTTSICLQCLYSYFKLLFCILFF